MKYEMKQVGPGDDSEDFALMPVVEKKKDLKKKKPKKSSGTA